MILLTMQWGVGSIKSLDKTAHCATVQMKGSIKYGI